MIENPHRAKRYFIDTEYNWDPNNGEIVPISIGIVAEDGREFYAITTAFAPRYCSPYVQEHVLPLLVADVGVEPIHEDRDTIAVLIKEFIGSDTPQFWGDYSAFDYVVLSMLMGDFASWPESWPMHINDMQQDAIPSIQAEIPHHALSDARAIRDAWDHAFAGTA